MAKKNSKQIYDEFVKSLDGKSFDELKKIEENLIKEIDKNDKKVATAVLPLSNENYSEVAKAIRYFLAKQKCQWQFTLGMMKLYEAWTDEKPDGVTYPVLDSTLRTLGQLEFTGYDEWSKVVLINEYFEPLRSKYVELTDSTYLLGEKHNALMNKMKLFDVPEAAEIPGDMTQEAPEEQ